MPAVVLSSTSAERELQPPRSPSVKAWSVVRKPVVGLKRKTVPPPPTRASGIRQFSPLPPQKVVPYRLPSRPCTTAPYGPVPSVVPSKTWSVVKAPVAGSKRNIVPCPEVSETPLRQSDVPPPQFVVPYK